MDRKKEFMIPQIKKGYELAIKDVKELIDKRINVLNNFDEFKGEIPKDEEALRDLIVQYYNDLKNEIISEIAVLTRDNNHTCLPLEEQSNKKRQTLKAHGQNQIGDVKSGNAVEGTEIQAVRNRQKPFSLIDKDSRGKK